MIDRYDVGAGSIGETTFDTTQFGDIDVHMGVLQHRDPNTSFWAHVGQGGSITAKAVVDGDLVFIGSCDHNMYALARDGREVWRFATKGTIQEGAVLFEDLILFGSKDGVFYALEKRTGKERWKFETRGAILEMATVHEGRVYFVSDDKNMYCLDAATGEEVWRFQGRQRVGAQPLIVNNRIYLGCEDLLLYCLNMDGKQLWSFKTQGMVAAWPAVHWNGRIYFGCFDGNLYCITAEKGELVWKKRFKAEVMTPFLWDDKLYVGCWDKNIYCLGAEKGEVLWSFKTQDMCTSYFEVRNGICFAGSLDHNVYAIDAKTGKEMWRFQTNGIIIQLVATDEWVLVGSWDCNLYCLDHQGTLVWKFRSALGSPSSIAPPETNYVKETQLVIPQEEVQEKEDKYQVRTTGEGSSDYVKKSDYVQEHKYTKTRKIKSMSSGWDD